MMKPLTRSSVEVKLTEEDVENYWPWNETLLAMIDNSVGSWPKFQNAVTIAGFHRHLKGLCEKWPCCTGNWRGALGTFTGADSCKANSTWDTISLMLYKAFSTRNVAKLRPVGGKQGNVYLEGGWDGGRNVQEWDGKNRVKKQKWCVNHVIVVVQLPARQSCVDHCSLNKGNKPDLLFWPYNPSWTYCCDQVKT